MTVMSVLMSVLVAGAHAADFGMARQARVILDSAGIQGGVVVHLGCGNGELTVALGAHANTLVHGLDTDEACVAQARMLIRAKDRYGRVSAHGFDGKHLISRPSSASGLVH